MVWPNRQNKKLKLSHDTEPQNTYTRTHPFELF